MVHALRRFTIVGIALVVVVAAIAWVSVTFTDRSFACGTALGEARHGETMPAVLFGSKPPRLGNYALPLGPGTPFVTLCRGQARARLVESGAAIVLAFVGVAIAYRRRRREPPDLAKT